MKKTMNIKQAFLLSSAFLLLLSITSCSDWLEMPSYTSADSENVFADEMTAEAFVKGCYRGIVPTEMVYQLAAGETVTHSSEDGTTNNGKYNICNWFYDSTSPYTVTSLYNESYGAIESTNLAIKKLGQMPESEKRNALLGEVLALRAFAYANLISVYGDVPAIWQPLEDLDPNDENTFYPKRTSRDIIYDQIVADLQTASQYVPWFEESNYPTTERLAKQGVLALLARVSLYAGGYSLRWDLQTNDPSTRKLARRDDAKRVRELYEIADKACREIIDHGQNYLVKSQGDMSGFQSLWYNFCQRNFGPTNAEMLWSLAQYGPNTNSRFGVYAHPGSRGGTFGSRKAMQFILPTYYLSFEPGDTRRDVTCTAYSIYFLEQGKADDTWVDVGTTYSCIMPGKFRISWCVEPQEAAKRNLNIPLLRYSDVLLMYAETQNYLNGGPTPQAIQALKEVRERAGIESLAVPIDASGFEDALAQERKWEFGGELTLRADLIRMGRIAKELKQTKQAMKDLSDRRGEYASVPTYRLYKFQKDAQQYGDPFLALDYIEGLTPAEIEIIKNIPGNKSDYADYQSKLTAIVEAHGYKVGNDDKWYPVNMFEAYTSTFNGNARKTVGFGKGFNALQIGKIIYQKPTGSFENGGTYPDWIEAADGSDGLYYGFKENHSELLPFANKSTGHPMVDNPNLTQLPGY